MTSTGIATLIHAAIAAFASCNWTHNNGRDESGEPNYCSGGDPDGCETCREADADARSAQDYGREAIDAIARGEFGEAAGLVRSANDCEKKWGDNPAWREAVNAAELLEWAEGAVLGHVDACRASDPDCDLHDGDRLDDPTLGERSTWSGRDGDAPSDEEWEALCEAAHVWRVHEICDVTKADK